MKPTFVFNVEPSLPDKLNPLLELAYNLRWCWNHETIDLFRRLDRDLWDAVNQNPIKMLGSIKQERLAEALGDDSLINHMQRVHQNLKSYVEENNWFNKYAKDHPTFKAAYFSAEFGLTECLPVYSGGLGILAGDHLKSASDLGVPLIGVGLLYTEGYFTQYLNIDGWQQERHPDNDFYTMPLRQAVDAGGKPIMVHVEMPDGVCNILVWKVQVGRNPLYLLDTNIPQNTVQYREITGQLYGGDLEMRMRQEIVLGIGGMRALFALGHHANVYHMNEGHAGFLALERMRMYMESHGISFAEARSVVRASNVFTTHTPVPAGIDVFPAEMIDRYFSTYYRNLGIDRTRFLALGRKNPKDDNEGFCMAVLAIRLAAFINGVSALHGEVSRKMWHEIWPALPLEEVPITHVTNGVHAHTWISKEMTDLLNRYLGPRALTNPSKKDIWDRMDLVPAEELWRTHERRRERLVSHARKRLRQQLINRGAPPAEIELAAEVLNPEVLTIGFARRFATYKRGGLIFKNPERLAGILNNKDRPVQIIFAGKAHPKDTQGKDIIRQIIRHAREPELRHRIVFLENYDLFLSRYLTQGVDVWMNTPRRPMEASGTSGMKAGMNGAINFSVLDGWWCECYNAGSGWAIGMGEDYDDETLQDEVESNFIYEILEKEIVPMFYDRGSDDLPRRWIEKMKKSMKAVTSVFNTDRMVKDYTNRFYVPCSMRHDTLTAESCKATREFTAWKQFVRKNWANIKFREITSDLPEHPIVGEPYSVTVNIDLDGLSQADVLVQLVYGPLDADGEIYDAATSNMEPLPLGKKKGTLFTAPLACGTSGRYGYTVRVLPTHHLLSDAFKMGLITWADGNCL